MSWEWEYRSKPQRWTLDIDGWRAIVRRVDGPGYQWSTSVESTSAPHERYDGPIDKDPMLGRTRCLTKIAELRQEKR